MTATVIYDYQKKPHFTLMWETENFSGLFFNRNVVSPIFIVHSIENIKWKAGMRLSGKAMELGLHRIDCDGPDVVEIKFEFAILSTDGSPLKRQASKTQFEGTDYCWLRIFEDSKEVFIQSKAGFLPNDTLTVRCRMWRKGFKTSKSESCFARTRLNTEQRSFIWAVREFRSLQPGQKRTHIVNPTSKRSPTLILSLFLSERNGETYVSIEITQNSAIRNINMFFKLSLLDSEGRVVHYEKTILHILVDSPDICIFREFFEKKKLVNKGHLLQNDILCLRCELESASVHGWSRIEHSTYFEPTTTETLDMPTGEQNESCTADCLFRKAFEGLYGDESLSDVSLRADTMLLPAHKTVLSVRSPVFKAMFTQNMREKTSQIVDIPDFNADTLGRMLLYIYKNTVQELQWESAMDLFRAADKYQLLDLRKNCSFFLKSNLSIINVCSILSLAVMHEDSDLQKAAEDFISQHDDKVFDSEEWKNFKEKDFQLAFEVMERIIRLIKRKKC